MSAAALVCPACRQAGRAWPLVVATTTCSNADCSRAYPRLDGTDIPVVLADPGVVADTRLDVRDAAAVGAWVDALEPGSETWEAAVRLGTYARDDRRGSDGLFQRLLDGVLTAVEGPLEHAVELGCGTGSFARLLAASRGAHVVGVDLWAAALRVAEVVGRGDEVHLPMLRAGGHLSVESLASSTPSGAGSVQLVCSDALAPPLVEHSYDLVVAINLFDSVADPSLAVGQASALVRDGGSLLLSQPDAWRASITPPERWLAEDAWTPLLEQYGLAVVARDDDLAWTLHRSERESFRYRSLALLARRTP